MFRLHDGPVFAPPMTPRQASMRDANASFGSDQFVHVKELTMPSPQASRTYNARTSRSTRERELREVQVSQKMKCIHDQQDYEMFNQVMDALRHFSRFNTDTWLPVEAVIDDAKKLALEEDAPPELLARLGIYETYTRQVEQKAPVEHGTFLADLFVRASKKMEQESVQYAQMQSALGYALLMARKLDEAQLHMRAAIILMTRLRGTEQHVDLAVMKADLALATYKKESRLLLRDAEQTVLDLEGPQNLWLAHVYYCMGCVFSRASFFQQCIEIRHNYPQGFDGLELLAFASGDKPRNAIGALHSCIRIKAKLNRITGKEYLALARSYVAVASEHADEDEKGGYFALAEEALKQSIRFTATLTGVEHMELGELYARWLDDHERAIDAYETALEILIEESGPDDEHNCPKLYRLLGESLLLSQRYDEAVETLLTYRDQVVAALHRYGSRRDDAHWGATVGRHILVALKRTGRFADAAVFAKKMQTDPVFLRGARLDEGKRFLQQV